MKHETNGTNAEPTVTTQLETITPELAQEYLGKNYVNNRAIGIKRVEYIASQIKRGMWILNGATISFDAEGNLTDGQHRLAAIIKAKKPIQSFVVRGLGPRAFHSIDTGRPRSAADAFRIAGESEASCIACACRFIMSYEREKGFGHKYKEKVAYADLAAVLKRNPGLRDAARKGYEYTVQIKRVGPSFITAFYYLASLVNAEEANAFFIHIFEGTDLTKGHPCLALRKILLDNAAMPSYQVTVDPTGLFRLWLKTWNLWAKGEQISSIRVHADDVLETFEAPVKDWRKRYGIAYPASDKSTAREREAIA